jgi:DNA modification methylase
MGKRKQAGKPARKTVRYATGRVLVGSCLDRLRDLPDGSVDSIVTDPPYELGFMGKAWDASGVAYSVELWQECLRVLKPGGHLLAFGGTRTYHRMVVAIEDAGFEIRDSIHWIYGSGFPKSLDVSKAIDKQRDDRAEVYEVTAWIRAARDAAGLSNRDIDDAFGFSGMAGHWTSSKSQPTVPTLEQVSDLLDVLGVTLDEIPARVRDLLWTLNGRKGQPGPNWAKREVTGRHKAAAAAAQWRANYEFEANLTPKEKRDKPATDAAKEWAGWGTALKPAHEPIVVARKPLDGTVAANVLAHGTGALNIDGCRIGTTDKMGSTKYPAGRAMAPGGGKRNTPEVTIVPHEAGRWPANVILDEAAGVELDAQSGTSKAGKPRDDRGTGGIWNEGNGIPCGPQYGDTGGASRFFYCPKPSRAERNAGLDDLKKADTPGVYAGRVDGSLDGHKTAARANYHPTVKPVALIRYLVRLVTPPGGVVLDPFLGSGTTAVAAIAEGFGWIGCELTPDYLPIIAGRVRHAQKKHSQLSLGV